MAFLVGLRWLDVVLALPVVVLTQYGLKLLHRKRYNVPPGPLPFPLIGNLLDIPDPKECEWLYWAKFKQRYGPISYVSVFGQDIIVLNERESAFDLLDKRSANYSDRPVLTFASKMCEWEKSLGLHRYNNRFKAIRKQIHQVIGTRTAAAKFYDLKEVEIRRFLFRMMRNSDQLLAEIRTTIGSIILKLSYGYNVDVEGRDPLVDLVNNAMHRFSLSSQPGKWLVDLVPALQYIPDWMPGSGFKKTAKSNRDFNWATTNVPYEFTVQQMSNGIERSSYMSALIEKGLHDDYEKDVAKWSASSLFVGGADTTVSATATFFLAMLLYPEAQKKAQEELDRVIGTDRLPSLNDRENLPYIWAMVKETLRWNPIGPMGLPHVSEKDDYYNGYFIPKGSLILANIWQMTHEPSVYHDPMDYKPERHLSSKEGEPEFDPLDIVFGFGRRLCPGKEIALNSIFISIAMTLAVFNIRKARDENGQEIEPLYEYIPGTITHPKEFKYNIQPRSSKAINLIKSVEEEHPIEPSDSRYLDGLM